MKILFGLADGSNPNGWINLLQKLVDMDLPIGLWAKIKRVLRSMQSEVQLYGAVRERILKEYCTLEHGENGQQFYKFPKPKDEKYPGFEKEWGELLNTELDVEYSPIEYLDIIDKTPDDIKKKLVVSNKDFVVLDILNDAYKEEKKVVTPDTSAGEQIKDAAIKPQADA